MTAPLKSLRHTRASLGENFMWNAVVARDNAFDGQFYTCVATTGVFCRPSCPARRPKRENVSFYATPEAARAAGFRPCKRCKPESMAPNAMEVEKIAAACRRIEDADIEPTLDELARSASLSPYHFHRRFKAIVGVTPKAYATAHRQNCMRENLKRSATVTDAIYKSGFNSSGRFYANSAEMLGMTPTDYRAGGASAEIRSAVTTCSLGRILVAASETGVCAVLLGDDAEELARELQRRFPKAQIAAGDGSFKQLVARVVAFVERPTPRHDLPLDIRGTAFQHRVWQALQDIPPGATANYSEIAERIGKPAAVRAVAHACAANPLAVVVPCHRVVRRDGELAGYRWGVERKRILLKREKGK